MNPGDEGLNLGHEGLNPGHEGLNPGDEGLNLRGLGRNLEGNLFVPWRMNDAGGELAKDKSAQHGGLISYCSDPRRNEIRRGSE